MSGVPISEAAMRDAAARGLCCAAAAQELGRMPCNLHRAAQRFGIVFPRRFGERNALIVALSEAGATHQDLAARFGLTRGRISQIMSAHREATNARPS